MCTNTGELFTRTKDVPRNVQMAQCGSTEINDEFMITNYDYYYTPSRRRANLYGAYGKMAFAQVYCTNVYIMYSVHYARMLNKSVTVVHRTLVVT